MASSNVVGCEEEGGGEETGYDERHTTDSRARRRAERQVIPFIDVVGIILLLSATSLLTTIG